MRQHTVQFQVPVRGEEFSAALEGLTRVNEGLMHEHPLPPLYESGVTYRDEPRDVWRNAPTVAGEGWGDCEDLSGYRAAELRVSGEDPAAAVHVYQSGPHRYHAVVLRGDGTIEDPSKALGMGAPKMPAMRRTRRGVNIIGADPTPDRDISFEILKIPGGGWGGAAGYRGYIRVPLGINIPSPAQGGAMVPAALQTIGPVATTPEKALQAAATQSTSTMTKVLTNPLVQTALAQIPGGSIAASVLANPTAQKIVSSGLKALKFW